jgi:hypothetical protein
MNFSAAVRRLAYVFVIASFAASLTSCSNPLPVVKTTEAQRVAQAFTQLSVGAKLKDGLPPIKLTPKLATRTSLPNGGNVSLWVASNMSRPALGRCYYLEFTSNKSRATSGQSSCGGATEQISLNRFGSVVLGDVGSWPATRVLVAITGNYVDLPVTKSYFLVPSAYTSGTSEKFRVTLLDAVRMPFAAISDLSAPGSGSPPATPGATAIQQLKRVLSPCTPVSSWPVRAISEGVRPAVVAYYEKKGLLPIRIYKNSENVLNLEDQSLGWHWCNTGDGIIGGYQGQVPLNATAAVMVYVYHAPYLVVNASEHFLTVAKIPGKGWQVVGENTAP